MRIDPRADAGLSGHRLPSASFLAVIKCMHRQRMEPPRLQFEGLSMSGMTIKNRAGKVFFQISSVEWLVILVSLVFGSLYCLTIPVMAGSDEDQHLLRVWEMSTFHFIPNEELAAGRIPFPLIYNG